MNMICDFDDAILKYFLWPFKLIPIKLAYYNKGRIYILRIGNSHHSLITRSLQCMIVF